MTYDSREDTLQHIEAVGLVLGSVIETLEERAIKHDASKLVDPEKPMFDIFRPLVKSLPVGSDEYRQALASMSEGLKHHYQSNRHHPEHFVHGVNDMTLVDVIEMVCDWYVAASSNGVPVNLKYCAERFGISEQLAGIIANTIEMLAICTEQTGGINASDDNE